MHWSYSGKSQSKLKEMFFFPAAWKTKPQSTHQENVPPKKKEGKKEQNFENKLLWVDL